MAKGEADGIEEVVLAGEADEFSQSAFVQALKEHLMDDVFDDAIRGFLGTHARRVAAGCVSVGAPAGLMNLASPEMDGEFELAVHDVFKQ